MITSKYDEQKIVKKGGWNNGKKKPWNRRIGASVGAVTPWRYLDIPEIKVRYL